MDGKLLIVGERYLFRLGKHQIAVRFAGRQERSQPVLKPKFLVLEHIGSGQTSYRTSARSLSRHYDDCYLLTRENGCRCAERLAAEGGK